MSRWGFSVMWKDQLVTEQMLLKQDNTVHLIGTIFNNRL